MAKRLILCSCSGTQSLDPKAISQLTGHPCSPLHNSLCSGEVGQAAEALTSPDAVICCGQEKNFFADLAEEIGVPAPHCIDLRDRAGWTSDTGNLLPKLSALIAEAGLDQPTPKTLDVISEGRCLIFGNAEIALQAAERLKGLLAVTVLLPANSPPVTTRAYDIVRGQLRRVEGALGQFKVRIDALETLDCTGRDWRWTPPRNGAQSACDIILDLSGKGAMVPAPDKREGYLYADPRHPAAVEAAIFEAAQLVGQFEKPLYVKTDPVLCAHARAGQTGCSKCLDHCPTSAISARGDHVDIDPMICAGCGACASLCPSGAITYDAPPAEQLFRRLQTLARAYLEAGGPEAGDKAPRLLVTTSRGSEMIELAARFDRGLPVDVIPLEVPALNSFGHAEILAALAAGFAHVTVVSDPKADLTVLNSEAELAQAIGGQERVSLLDFNDPTALCDWLYDEAAQALIPPPVATPVRPMGSRRQIARQAALALTSPEVSQCLPLPKGAPYGAVLVDPESCTLCLACTSLCPSGALGDNPDLPQLRFQEEACLQCGLCAGICPEQAITLAPRLDLSTAALSQRVLHQEEPFACVECGALFGVKSSVEKIKEKLAGNHSIFADPATARMIEMCDDCRVQAQFHQHKNPMTGAARPRVRTTEDYLKERQEH